MADPSHKLKTFAQWIARYAEENNMGVLVFVRDNVDQAPMAMLVSGKTDAVFARMLGTTIISQADICRCIVDAAAMRADGVIGAAIRDLPLDDGGTEH